MPTLLFWNLAGNPVQDLIGEVAQLHNVDLLVLAESEINPATLLESLNSAQPSYQFAFGFSKKLAFFGKFHAGFLTPTYESERISIRRLNLPGREEILVAAAHLPSRMYYSEDDLFVECSLLSDRIEEQEKKAGHNRTVLLGDFNLNPFDKGIVAAGGLHAVMSREVAARGSRTVQGREHHFFYNPMWAQYSNPDTPGTYYYERAVPINYFWNMYDQILLRPALLSASNAHQIEVLTAIGATPLLGSSGRPDRNAASDHLPVLLRLEF